MKKKKKEEDLVTLNIEGGKYTTGRELINFRGTYDYDGVDLSLTVSYEPTLNCQLCVVGDVENFISGLLHFSKENKKIYTKIIDLLENQMYQWQNLILIDIHQDILTKDFKKMLTDTFGNIEFTKKYTSTNNSEMILIGLLNKVKGEQEEF